MTLSDAVKGLNSIRTQESKAVKDNVAPIHGLASCVVDGKYIMYALNYPIESVPAGWTVHYTAG